MNVVRKLDRLECIWMKYISQTWLGFESDNVWLFLSISVKLKVLKYVYIAYTGSGWLYAVQRFVKTQLKINESSVPHYCI